MHKYLEQIQQHRFGQKKKKRKRKREVERESKTELVVLIFPFALGSEAISLGVALFPRGILANPRYL